MVQTVKAHWSGHIIIENIETEPHKVSGRYSLAIDKIYCISPFQYQGPELGVSIFVLGADESFDVQLPLEVILDAIGDARLMFAARVKHV